MIKIYIADVYEIDSDKFETAMSLIKSKKVALYAMSGKMGVGKDTVGDGIQEAIELQGSKVVSISYSRPMRSEMQSVVDFYNDTRSFVETADKFNVDESQVQIFLSKLGGKEIYERTDESRLAVQYWGTDVRRNQNHNYWVNQLAKIIVEELCKGNTVKVSDVRFPNEADSILALNGKIVRIELPSEVQIERIKKRDNIVPTEEQLTHLSETAMDIYYFDKIFDGSQNVSTLVNQSLNYILEEKQHAKKWDIYHS